MFAVKWDKANKGGWISRIKIQDPDNANRYLPAFCGRRYEGMVPNGLEDWMCVVDGKNPSGTVLFLRPVESASAFRRRKAAELPERYKRRVLECDKLECVQGAFDYAKAWADDDARQVAAFKAIDPAELEVEMVKERRLLFIQNRLRELGDVSLKAWQRIWRYEYVDMGLNKDGERVRRCFQPKTGKVTIEKYGSYSYYDQGGESNDGMRFDKGGWDTAVGWDKIEDLPNAPIELDGEAEAAHASANAEIKALELERGILQKSKSDTPAGRVASTTAWGDDVSTDGVWVYQTNKSYIGRFTVV